MIKNIIYKKLKNNELTKDEIEYFVNGLVKGDIKDYQASSLITAMYLNKINDQELKYLTSAMANSGKQLNLSKIDPNIVDKHSTGGVGDKVSIILFALLASVGVSIAKMSGRSLGHTGGTIDKLESIPGFTTNLDIEKFENNIRAYGMGLMSQTEDIAIADKIIYSIRDSISCIDDVSLITSSIMSKKLACGAKNMVMEITVGSGALIRDLKTAKILANKMMAIAKDNGINMVCILVNMDQMLGSSVGNSLEIQEAIDFLSNKKRPNDLYEVIVEIASYMICLYFNTKLNEDNLNITRKLAKEQIESGELINHFKTFVKIHGGNLEYINDSKKLNNAKYIEHVTFGKGYIKSFQTDKIGQLVNFLGAGRSTIDDNIDYDVGIVFHKKVGDYIESETHVATIYANDRIKLNVAKDKLKQLVELSDNEVEKPKTIIEIIK